MEKTFLRFILKLIFEIVTTSMILIAYISCSLAADINVPNTYTTIQAAIDAADVGDVIFVNRGIYYENVNFLGKAITIKSTDPYDSEIVKATIIDGNQVDSVITFCNGEGSDSLVEGFSIRNGKTENGGGIHCRLASPTIINCIINGNLALGYGGGIHCELSSSPIIINCIISNNKAKYGSAICCNLSSPIITYCTVTNNLADEGGGIYCINSLPKITNCIFWEDLPDEIFEIESNIIPVIYSNIQLEEGEVYKGINNINEDPLFIDSNIGNYYLQPNSPCIDAGINEKAPLLNILTEEEKIKLEEEKWELIRTRTYPARLRKVLTLFRNGYKIIPGTYIETPTIAGEGILRPQDGDADGIAESDMGTYEYCIHKSNISSTGSSLNDPSSELCFLSSIDL